jgi:hypothetical protein
MKNKDIHQWLLDNCIDSLLTIKDTKGAEIYLTDLLTKHLTEQLQQHGVVRGGDSESQLVERTKRYFKYPDWVERRITPPEPLPAEGSAKTVSSSHYTAMCKYEGGDCKCTSVCLFE